MTVNIRNQFEYWRTLAYRTLGTAEDLFRAKRYDACLFFCHLALEKMLKALVVQRTNQPAPYIHDLEKLASVARLQMTEEQTQYFRHISTFNVAARYDDVKLAFYKQCTKHYSGQYFSITKQLYLWLKKESLKK